MPPKKKAPEPPKSLAEMMASLKPRAAPAASSAAPAPDTTLSAPAPTHSLAEPLHGTQTSTKAELRASSRATAASSIVPTAPAAGAAASVPLGPGFLRSLSLLLERPLRDFAPAARATAPVAALAPAALARLGVATGGLVAVTAWVAVDLAPLAVHSGNAASVSTSDDGDSSSSNAISSCPRSPISTSAVTAAASSSSAGAGAAAPSTPQPAARLSAAAAFMQDQERARAAAAAAAASGTVGTPTRNSTNNANAGSLTPVTSSSSSASASARYVPATPVSPSSLSRLNSSAHAAAAASGGSPLGSAGAVSRRAPVTWLCEAWPLQSLALDACRLAPAPVIAAALAALPLAEAEAAASATASGSSGTSAIGQLQLQTPTQKGLQQQQQQGQSQGCVFSCLASLPPGTPVTVSVPTAAPAPLASITLVHLSDNTTSASNSDANSVVNTSVNSASTGVLPSGSHRLASALASSAAAAAAAANSNSCNSTISGSSNGSGRVSGSVVPGAAAASAASARATSALQAAARARLRAGLVGVALLAGSVVTVAGLAQGDSASFIPISHTLFGPNNSGDNSIGNNTAGGARDSDGTRDSHVYPLLITAQTEVTVLTVAAAAVEGAELRLDFKTGLFNVTQQTQEQKLRAAAQLASSELAKTDSEAERLELCSPLPPIPSLTASNGNSNSNAATVSSSSSHGVVTRGGQPSWGGLTSVGGLDREIASLREVIHLPLTSPHLFTSFGLRPPRGVLLYGPPGTGKTMLARALAKESFSSFIAVDGAEITGRYVGESEARVKAIFSQAAASAPCVVFIDEIDAMCPSRDSAADEVQKRIVATLLTAMDGLGADARVVVLAATNRPNALDAALRRPGRFDREVEVGVPTRAGRAEILTRTLAPLKHCVSAAQAWALVEKAHGYVGADIQLVVREAVLECLRRCHSNGSNASVTGASAAALPEGLDLTAADVALGFASVRPSAMREVALDVPSVRWSDIGGQEEVKQHLTEAFEWPLEDPEVFTRLGVAPPRGILLYGPPGCSKTLLAKALATESSRNFIAVKGPELFSKWVGDSEKAVRDVFRKARAAAPSIIFFDEIDSLAAARSSGGGGDAVVERVLSQLLIELDGVQPLTDVTVLAATNRPDLLDPALLRPGRIDRAVYVAPPDLRSTGEIFKIEFRKITMAPDAQSQAAVDAVARAAHGKGLSGAELSAVCREAALLAMGEDVQAKWVEVRHVMAAIEKAEARISKDMLAFFDRYRQKTAVIE